MSTKILYPNIALPFSGLSNQIFNFVSTLIIAHQQKYNVIFFNSFMKEILSNKKCHVSDIIDFSFLNSFLKSNHYPFLIMDQNHQLTFQIESVFYGITDHYIDITSYIIEHFFKNNLLYIPKTFHLNSLGDPIPLQQKHILLKYKLNDSSFQQTFPELNGFLKYDVKMNLNLNSFSDPKWTYVIGKWITSYDEILFNFFLENIKFQQIYYEKANIYFTNHIQNKNSINIIHLRLENDGISHWAGKNKLSPLQYTKILEQKYIDIISKYIQKEDSTILLTYNDKNNVINYLQQHNYTYYITPKNYNEGREINAIIDLIIGTYCNNLFIGNFNIQNKNGSSFSYYLYKIIKNAKTSIFIDLDNIRVPPRTMDSVPSRTTDFRT
jgi:hypothetical protein